MRERLPRKTVQLEGQLFLAGGALLDVRLVDLSYDGCLIEVPRSVTPGDEVRLTVGSRGAGIATVRWYKNGRAGLQFAPVAPSRLKVERKSSRLLSGVKVQLRRIGRLSYSVVLRDLSPEGCMIDLVERPEIGEVMQLKLPGLETMQARVCWIDNYIAGVEFERPIHEAVFELLIERLAR